MSSTTRQRGRTTYACCAEEGTWGCRTRVVMVAPWRTLKRRKERILLEQTVVLGERCVRVDGNAKIT